jgi:RHS repeat-associated protein
VECFCLVVFSFNIYLCTLYDAFYGDSTQLVYLRARWYNPVDGRFQSRDTWSGIDNRPLSLNKWIYVEGNPINLTDPSGMCGGSGEPPCPSQTPTPPPTPTGTPPYQQLKSIQERLKDLGAVCTQRPIGFKLKNNYSYAFHIALGFSSGRDMSSDDFTGSDSGACLNPQVGGFCAIAAVVRLLPSKSLPENSKFNFWVDYAVTHDEYSGIIISDFRISNYTGESVNIGLSFESGGQTYYPGAITVRDGFGADYYHQSFGSYNGKDPLVIDLKYEKVINLGSASKPGPSIIYPLLIHHVVPSVTSLKDTLAKSRKP